MKLQLQTCLQKLSIPSSKKLNEIATYIIDNKNNPKEIVNYLNIRIDSDDWEEVLILNVINLCHFYYFSRMKT